VTTAPGLILASTSPYRQQLLNRLRLPFETRSPGVDEATLPDEAPSLRSARLALAKARAVALSHPDRVVIGADQVAACEGRILDKPGRAAQARQQLRHQSGRSVEFYSAVAVVCLQRGYCEQFVDLTIVHLRTLSELEIESYIRADEPFDCAGALRSESLGVSLCERIDSSDPTGLIGLPLIRLSATLRACGYALP
jgi:septum formation protein